MPTEAELKKLPRPEPVSEVSNPCTQPRHLIVFGRLAPGTRIVEVELAGRLGVGSTPVRDALRMMQQAGFVMAGSLPGGVKARLVEAPFTREDAEELYGIVGRIENLAASRTALLGSTVRGENFPEAAGVE